MTTDWQPPRLETARLLLRPLTEADAPAVFAYASNPAVARFTTWETHQTLDDTRAFLRDYIPMRLARQEPDPLGICLKSDPDAVIGSLGCRWASQNDRTLELGYLLAEPFWGRGLASEAASELLRYVFASTDVERVQAYCVTENVASVRVLKKLGFTHEGILRHAGRKFGLFHDLHIFSVLRGERP